MTVVVFAAGLLGIHNTLAEGHYDVKTVETVGGRVLSIEKTAPSNRRGYWINALLQTGQGNRRGAAGASLVHRQPKAAHPTQ